MIEERNVILLTHSFFRSDDTLESLKSRAVLFSQSALFLLHTSHPFLPGARYRSRLRSRRVTGSGPDGVRQI